MISCLARVFRGQTLRNTMVPPPTLATGPPARRPLALEVSHGTHGPYTPLRVFKDPRDRAPRALSGVTGDVASLMCTRSFVQVLPQVNLLKLL
jgi:hypothetical protein